MGPAPAGAGQRRRLRESGVPPRLDDRQIPYVVQVKPTPRPIPAGAPNVALYSAGRRPQPRTATSRVPSRACLEAGTGVRGAHLARAAACSAPASCPASARRSPRAAAARVLIRRELPCAAAVDASRQPASVLLSTCPATPCVFPLAAALHRQLPLTPSPTTSPQLRASPPCTLRVARFLTLALRRPPLPRCAAPRELQLCSPVARLSPLQRPAPRQLCRRVTCTDLTVLLDDCC